MDRGKISVIIPVYNVSADLSRCLDSVLAQTYKNMEIIAVNDGSTDNSGEILERYAAKFPQIKVIHQTNGGVTTARLHGVSLSSGDWIGFVDGDDEIEPDMYERLMVNALKYHADISHCGYQMVFPDGRVNYFYNTGYLAEQDKTAALRELLSGSRIEPGLCNKLFHKSLFHSLLHNNLMDLSIKINEDLLMNFYLFRQAEKSVFEDFCPYHYIVRSNSASRQKLNEHKIYDPIKVKEFILAASPDDVQEKAQQAYMSTCVNVYNGIILVEQPELEKDRMNVRQMIRTHWDWARYLSKNQHLLARLIRYAPWLYKPIYRFYAVHILKSPYV